MSAVALESVRFRYPGADRDALDSVSLECKGGDVTWLFGALGAGCTTLLLVAGGLAPRHTGGTLSGTVRLLGLDPAAAGAQDALAGRVAHVTQAPALQLSSVAATVWEEVAFAPANLGWPRARIQDAVDTALERLGVAELAAREPASLSGGEMQRVVIAGMLVLEPEVWLLDEPGIALDRAGRELLDELVGTEARRGAAVVVASEDADATLPAATRVVVLDGGRVALDGAPGAVLAGEEIWACGAGSTSIAELARGAGLLVAAPGLAPPFPLDAAAALRRWQ